MDPNVLAGARLGAYPIHSSNGVWCGLLWLMVLFSSPEMVVQLRRSRILL